MNRIFGLVTLVLLSTMAQASDMQLSLLGNGAAELSRIPAKSEASYKLRVRRIKAELAKIKNQPWVGEYRSGGGFGLNRYLLVGATTGFVYSAQDCVGLISRNYGSAEWSANKVSFMFEQPNDSNNFGLASEFTRVIWHKRHYLIPANEFIDFVNAINSGSEPCSDNCTQFLLKVGDEKRHAFGAPTLPAEFQQYLLNKPLLVDIDKIIESRVELADYDSGVKNRRTKVMLNAGSNNGIFMGMELHALNPRDISVFAKVTKVQEEQSEAEIVQISVTDPTPTIGWKFSTKMMHPD
jgi:hypothetical protein